MAEAVLKSEEITQNRHQEPLKLPDALVIPSRLRSDPIYSRCPDYFNIETTLPCKVGPASYLDPRIDSHELRQALKQNLRVVVPERVALSQMEDVRLLSSPYECGRVLEGRDPIRFCGTEHVILIKGGGANRFIRDQRRSDWNGIREYFDNEFSLETSKLRSFSKNGLGVFHEHHAWKAVKKSQEMEALGIDAERTVAIFPIEAIPVENGGWITVDEMHRAGLLDDIYSPVLSMRLVRSNYRLEEVRMLWELDQYDCGLPFLEHCVARYQAETGAQGGIQDYYDWLVQKVIRQESSLMYLGYQLGTSNQTDIKRNISILGEELDLESFKRDSVYDRPEIDIEIWEQFSRDAVNEMTALVNALRIFGYEMVELAKVEISLAGLHSEVERATDLSQDCYQFPRSLVSRIACIGKGERERLIPELSDRLRIESFGVLERGYR